MRVLLRNTKTGLYLQGPEHWTERISEALDLQTRHDATAYAFQIGFQDVELFYDPGTIQESPKTNVRDA
jgi:hypothetical protein